MLGAPRGHVCIEDLLELDLQVVVILENQTWVLWKGRAAVAVNEGAISPPPCLSCFIKAGSYNVGLPVILVLDT